MSSGPETFPFYRQPLLPLLPQQVGAAIDELSNACRSIPHPVTYVQPYSYSNEHDSFCRRLIARSIRRVTWRDLHDYCDESGGNFRHASAVTSKLLLPHVLLYWSWSTFEQEGDDRERIGGWSHGFESAYLALTHHFPLKCEHFLDVRASALKAMAKGFQHYVYQIDWSRHAAQATHPLLLSHLETIGCVTDEISEIVDTLFLDDSHSSRVAAHWIMTCFFELGWSAEMARPSLHIPFATSVAAPLFNRLCNGVAKQTSWSPSAIQQLEEREFAKSLIQRVLMADDQCTETDSPLTAEFMNSVRTITAAHTDQITSHIQRYLQKLRSFPANSICSTTFCNT